MKVGAVIVCAGSGKRLKGINKAFLKLGAKPLLKYSLEVFAQLKPIKQIVLVLKPEDFPAAKKIIGNQKVALAEGGPRRQDSVYSGLLALREDIDYVLIHDGCRPLLHKKTALLLIKALKTSPAVICGLNASDTLKLVVKSEIKKTVRRDNIFAAQTPQGFRKKLIIEAYQKFKQRKLTDDAQAVELLGKKVRVIEGSRDNIKITYPEDIKLAEAMLGHGR